MTTGTRRIGRVLLWAILSGLAAVVVVTAVVAADPGSPSSQTVGDLAILAASLTATVSCARAAARRGPDARAWRWIGAATLVWTAGMVAWTFYGLTRGHDYPFPSVADAGFLGYSLPALAGLLAFPRPRVSSVTTARTMLDASVIAVAVLFISWSTVLGRVHQAEDPDPLAHLTILAYPAVDIVVASFVLVLTMRQSPGQRLPWLCLGGGFLLLTVTDSIYVRLTFEGVTGTTGTPLVAGWICAFLLVALGAALPGSTRPRPDRPVYATAARLLPVVPALAAVLVAASLPVTRSDPFLLVTGLAGLAVALARQVLLVYENVTLTRELEDKVAQRTAELENLAAIVDSSPDAIVGKTAHGVVTSWNPGAERVYGYPAEEAIGRHIRFVLLEEDLEAEEALLATIRENGVKHSFETERRRKDGTLVPLALTMFPVRGHHGIASIAQDITERRRTQAELLSAREAALESSRLKSEFLATMSHEIRTPMNGVVGLTSLLLETSLDDVQRQYAEGVRSAGEALLTLINDILDFSKLEAGRVDLDPVPLDPRRLVDEVVGLLAEQAQGKGLELIGHCDPAVPARLVGDARALRQILLNLVSNAVKFTGAGEVAVLVQVEEQVGDSSVVRFEVHDTGIGIPPEHQDLVFDSFAQADASTTRRYGGTGLGLAISRRLTEALGGRIGVRSTPGRGSVFWVSVPLPRAEAEDPALAPRPGDLPAGLRVLVVDDNATNRLVLESQLTAWHLLTTTARDAREALDALRSAAAGGRPFDIAVLDLCMPGTDGLELARSVHGDSALAGTAVIVLTSAGRPNRAELAAAGVRELLSKPVRSSELHDRLSRLVAASPTDARPAADGGVPAPAPPAAPVLAPVPAPAGGPSRGRLLVVEDNEVNQLVARSMAERLGFDVDVVADGAQAVEATRSTGYVAVLMDCHMPVLDGFEATRAIRGREGRDTELPIIAMTAGAMAEDRRRCTAAGMDDYITKPVDLATLESVLDRWTRPPAPGTGPSAVTGRVEPEPAATGPSAPAVDPARLELLRTLGDHVLVATAHAFLQESRSSMRSLRQACPEGGAPMQSAAHKLVGSAGNIGATRAAELCRRIEEHGRRGTPLEPHLLPQLEDEMRRVRDCLERILPATT
ncbi:response regulator [Kocuria sp. M1R5S2]|uniref:PAS domain-containing hybrid sensor histidine kinase/response regulator n=1 Tax=Kocuria rhizosphaerae TaxID=3376285 RepID=UPI003795CDD0